MMDDRAVTELLGYVFVFTLIMSTIALVLLLGLPTLESAQEAEQVNNVERAFDVLDDNLQDIQYEGVDTRSTELRLAGGSVSHGEPVAITVRVDGVDVFNDETTPLQYEKGGTEIVYIAGAVMRVEESGEVVLNEPDHTIEEDRVAFRLSLLEGSGGVTGDTTVRVQAQESTRDSVLEERDPDSVTIEINETSTARADAWKQYFDEDVVDDPDPERVVVEIDDPERFDMQVTWIETSLYY